MLNNLIEGYCTLVYPNGEHRTLRVERAMDDFFGFFSGQLIVGYLNGSNNETNYRFIGRVQNGQLFFFKKVVESESPERIARFRAAFEILNRDVEQAGKAYALQSGNCWRCNRLLTTPESIESGIGPVCARKLAA
jgi:hypothetical protein